LHPGEPGLNAFSAGCRGGETYIGLVKVLTMVSEVG
jgi:hypothetical protein